MTGRLTEQDLAAVARAFGWTNQYFADFIQQHYGTPQPPTRHRTLLERLEARQAAAKQTADELRPRWGIVGLYDNDDDWPLTKVRG